MNIKDILLKLKLVEETPLTEEDQEETNTSSVKESEELDNSSETEEETSKTIEELEQEKENLENCPIRFKAIIEVAGQPESYVNETLKQYIQQIKDAKIKVIHAHIEKAEKKETFYSSFAELEIAAKKPSELLEFCFDFMPASMEIIEPSDISFSGYELSNALNDLQARLHRFDLAVKELTAKNKLLDENAKLILRNNILLSLKEKDKNLEQVSKNIGIDADKTELFLDALVTQKFLNKNKDLYSLNREKVTFSD